MCRARRMCCASGSATSALLEGELATKNEWLEKAQSELSSSIASTRSCWTCSASRRRSWKSSNRWAEALNQELDERARAHRRTAGGDGARAGSRAQSGRRLRSQGRGAGGRMSAQKTQWALETEDAPDGESCRSRPRSWRSASTLLHQTEADAGGTHGLGAAPAGRGRRNWTSSWRWSAASRWVKLGRKVGLGPDLRAVDMALLKRVLRALPLLLLSPSADGDQLLALALTRSVLDAVRAGRLRRPPAHRLERHAAHPSSSPTGTAATCWRSICPRIEAALAGNPDNEIIVVDNGSTDGSAEFLRAAFPAREGAGARRGTWASAAARTPASAPPRTTSSCC